VCCNAPTPSACPANHSARSHDPRARKSRLTRLGSIGRRARGGGRRAVRGARVVEPRPRAPGPRRRVRAGRRGVRAGARHGAGGQRRAVRGDPPGPPHAAAGLLRVVPAVAQGTRPVYSECSTRRSARAASCCCRASPRRSSCCSRYAPRVQRVQYEEIRQGRLMLLPGFSASFQLLLKVRAPCTASASIKGLLTGFPCEAVRARAAVRQCGRTRASQLTPASVAGRRYNCNVLTSCVGWGRAQSMVHKEAAMRPTAGGILKNSALA
jgi:hypothetical protein